MNNALNINGEYIVTDAMIDPYYSYQHVNMGRITNSATFIAVPQKGQTYMTAVIEAEYVLRAVFFSDNEEVYEPVYNKGERYIDGSYMTDINYPHTDTLQYGKVCLNISQNCEKLHHEEKSISVTKKGQGVASFVVCIELDDDSPVSITLRMPLSHYIYCDIAKRQLKRIEYMLKVENGEVRFSDSDDVFEAFSSASKEYVDELINNHKHSMEDIEGLEDALDKLKITVENISPDENGNIDLEEIAGDDINSIWGETEGVGVPGKGTITVEHIAPDENGNIDLEEINGETINSIWNDIEGISLPGVDTANTGKIKTVENIAPDEEGNVDLKEVGIEDIESMWNS